MHRSIMHSTACAQRSLINYIDVHAGGICFKTKAAIVNVSKG